MSKTEKYDPLEDRYDDIKRHDNPNHWGHFKHETLRQTADEELQEYVDGTVFTNSQNQNDRSIRFRLG